MIADIYKINDKWHALSHLRGLSGCGLDLPARMEKRSFDSENPLHRAEIPPMKICPMCLPRLYFVMQRSEQ
jgi:hypothetical protein